MKELFQFLNDAASGKNPATALSIPTADVANFCKCYSDRYVARGEPPLTFTESTKKLLDELHERTVDAEIHERNQKRLLCYRNRNGFCAPCRFDCKHYCQGRCVDIKEIKDDDKVFPDDSDCA